MALITSKSSTKITIALDIILSDKLCVRIVKRNGQLIYKEKLYSLNDWHNRKGHKVLNEFEDNFLFASKKSSDTSCERNNIRKYRNFICSTQFWLVGICLKLFQFSLNLLKLCCKEKLFGNKSSTG